ncbi:hypothetical protein HanHA300_Chr10g0351641 [Helianthus annuus]|nr:hypothetical protein HanHA300_Chr10g0351641 [Helianthus annuus]KAJ0529048.1 hypothetical protein HanHA89_Chr10g0373321 [Helianthus annuus]
MTMTAVNRLGSGRFQQFLVTSGEVPVPLGLCCSPSNCTFRLRLGRCK